MKRQVIALFGSANNGKSTYFDDNFDYTPHVFSDGFFIKTINKNDADAEVLRKKGIFNIQLPPVFFKVHEYVSCFKECGGIINETACEKDKLLLEGFCLGYFDCKISDFGRQSSLNFVSDRSYFDLMIYATENEAEIRNWIDFRKEKLKYFCEFYTKIIFFDRFFEIKEASNNPNRSKNVKWLECKYQHAKLCFEILKKEYFDKFGIETEIIV